MLAAYTTNPAAFTIRRHILYYFTPSHFKFMSDIAACLQTLRTSSCSIMSMPRAYITSTGITGGIICVIIGNGTFLAYTYVFMVMILDICVCWRLLCISLGISYVVISAIISITLFQGSLQMIQYSQKLMQEDTYVRSNINERL